MKNYYQVLGLDESASFDDVRQAYLKYAVKFHPDLHNNDEFFKERFQEINEAYEYIKAHQRGVNSNEAPHYDYPHEDEHKTSVKESNQQADLAEEALKYFENHEIEILNQYGFFNTKKKRQASTIWASCIVCIILSIIAGAMFIQYLGIEHFGVGGIFIYILAISIGMYPGLITGPVILGLNDKNHLNVLADNIKKQFVKDYIKEHRK